jgi:GcrA cell cycle regulator
MNGLGRLQRLLARLGQEYLPSDHSARRPAAATAIGAVRMLWTAEAVEDLKKLALEGKSASHISAALGVGSRNAVIGKASRIGIKLGGGGRGPGTRKAPAARPQWAKAPYPRHRADHDGSDLALVGDPRVKPREGRAAWTLGEVEIGEMRRVRFEEIREFACRWPLGDPRSGEFTYCGLTPAKGQSYCAGHCRMAYRAPQPRAIAREPRVPAIASSWRLS